LNCAACGEANREGRKFCGGCGARLALTCAACGEANEPGEKFCGECGGSLIAGPAEASGARKVITIVFADLVGSTALHERLDPESVRLFMEGYYRAMRGAVEAHGGSVTQLLGDGVKAVFGVPKIAEDDAIRAVRAAVAMQRAFRVLAEQHQGLVGKTGLRIAVNTGEVVATDGAEIIGDPVNVAARLQEQGRDGDVVIGESTRNLVATLVTLELLGSFTLKGRAEAVTAYQVASLERPARATAGAFVGRDDELARIMAVYESALAAPAARLAVVLGSPGLGKSRLIEELPRRLGDGATVVAAHCDAAGGATFAPVAAALRALLQIDDGTSGEALLDAIGAALPADDADRARIATGVAALVAGSPASPEETFFVVRRFLGALAQSRPVVFVIDDLHWAEPLLLDLVEHLVQWGGGVPLFVLAGARPELRDVRSTLVAPGSLVADVVTLGGLEAWAAMRLAANVIGAADLPAAVAAKVLATSEGNPLFVGELVRMLVQEGALTKEGERWTTGAGLASLEMPPTIHALLASRIERLKPEERGVLERAAVVGRHFSRSAVAALLPADVKDLDARLESLRRSELIERDTGWMLGEPALRFHHLLIRDAAYRRLLKGTRAELHARLADWIEAQVGDAPEHDETIGRHLEQAHQHLRELGPLDESGRRLGERAAARLAAAGRAALARDDVPLAASLLGRAIAGLDAADPARADLALDWCEALLASGDVAPAGVAIDELGRFTAGSERLRAWHACFAAQLTVLTAPQELQGAADAVAAAATQLGALDDAAGEAKAHSVHAQALARLGKVGACEAALDRALAAARRAGDRRRANAVLAGAPLAALWGPSPVTRASGRCLDVVRVLRITQGAPAVEAVALSCQGVLEALRGRTDAARRMLASSRKMVEELGIAHRLFEADAFSGRIAVMEGDATVAERLLRGAYEGLRDLGLGIDAARAGALLARTLLAQGRGAEAEALSHESEHLAGDDLQAAIAWRGVRAEALAQRGEHAAAIELAQAAVAIASATDALLDHADARMALAAALRAAGRATEADAEERHAIELWEAKGATLLAEHARRASKQATPATETSSASSLAVAPATPSHRAHHRMRPNAATRDAERVWAASASRDLDELMAAHADGTLVVHHPTAATYGGPQLIAMLRAFWRAKNLVLRQDVLATLGDSLALVRRSFKHDGAEANLGSIGPVEVDVLCLCEADDHEPTTRRWEVFAEDRLGDAIARLYERHAELLAEGAERDRAAATARALGTMLSAPNDIEHVATVIAPDFESIDHRHLSTWSLRGGDAFLEHMRALQAVADDIVIGVDDVLALEPRAHLVRRMHSGTERVGGGAYERPFLVLFATDGDGRLARAEWFEADDEARALARIDELAVDTARPIRPVRVNAATATLARFDAAVVAGDAAAFDDLHGDPFEEIDHPTGSTYGRDGALASVHRLLHSHGPWLEHEALASLGESLVLFRRRVGARGASSARYDVGAWDREEIGLAEVNEAGRLCRSEIFAADHLGDAVIRLYERHAELLPEGAARARADATARTVRVVAPGGFDREQYAAAFRPDAAIVDHKLLGFGTDLKRETLFDSMAAWWEVGTELLSTPQDVLALTHDALLLRWRATGLGRESGGALEWAFLRLFTFDHDGRVARYELFDADREAEALARFAEIASPAPIAAAPSRFENVASRAWREVITAWRQRDVARFEQLHPRPLRYRDHRRLVQLDLDRAGFLDFTRPLLLMRTGSAALELLATRGECLALMRSTLEIEDEAVGPSAIDSLVLIETAEHGTVVAYDRYDAGELDAAWTELDARWQAGASAVASAVAFVRRFDAALQRRDWDAMAACYAPDFVGHDDRLVSWGTLRGPAAFIQVFRVLVELAPDARLRWDHTRTSQRGLLVDCAWVGTRDGGAFESPFVFVAQLDADHLTVRCNFFDPHHLERARARFAEIDASPAHREPLAALLQQNLASAALDRWEAAYAAGFDAGDWEPMRAICVPGFVFDDRGRLALVGGDRELMIASARERAAMGARPRRTLVATLGDRVAIEHVLWTGGPAEGPFEIEYVGVIEADPSGLMLAVLLFDVDDRGAASVEGIGRFAASDAAGVRAIAAYHAFATAFGQHDWHGLARTFAPDLKFVDRRRLGFGTIDSDLWLESLRAHAEMSPDLTAEGVHVLAWNAHGLVIAVRTSGTVPDGGPFENLFLTLAVIADDRIEVFETFELDDEERALARFAELCAARPGPTGVVGVGGSAAPTPSR